MTYATLEYVYARRPKAAYVLHGWEAEPEHERPREEKDQESSKPSRMNARGVGARVIGISTEAEGS